MRFLKCTYLALSIFAITSLTACSDDDDVSTPITLGSTVTVTNTFQAEVNTGGVETPIETLFMLGANELAATTTVSEAVEFPAYLLGLYDIDLSENSITFELVAAADDPTYSDFFRTLEAGTIDRYYLTFTEAQDISGFSSDNSSVSLRIDSDNVVVVEIGEGFNFNPGAGFTITLN